MKTHYDPEADALYVRFADAAIVESEEVTAGVILDFDAEGRIVLSSYSKRASISHRELSCRRQQSEPLPSADLHAACQTNAGRTRY